MDRLRAGVLARVVPRITGQLPVRFLWLGVFGLVLALLPLTTRSTYVLTMLIFVGLYTVLTAGLCLLMGYAGQVSLGHAAFYGLGAYTSGILTVKAAAPPWLGVLLALALSGGVALLIAHPIFKLSGHYLAMATLGFGTIVMIFFTEAVGLTGGPSGLTGVPYLRIGGWVVDRDVETYALVWCAALLVLALSLNLVNSRMGRALRAIHGSEVAAMAMGVHAARLKVQVFVVSALFAGLAGSLYAHYVTFVNPSPFGFHFSIMLVVMASVGGVGTVWGAPLGAAVVVLLGEALRTLVPSLLAHAGGSTASGEVELLAFGLLLMGIMIFMPEGVVPRITRLWDRRQSHDRDVRLPNLRDLFPNVEGLDSDKPGDAPVRPTIIEPGSAPAGRVPIKSEARLAEPEPGRTHANQVNMGSCTAVLRVKGVTKAFGGVVAVSELSFEANLGEVVAVIGPNGAGKTTLFNIISGVLAPDAGEIWFENRRIDLLPAHRVAWAGVARTFQNVQLFGNMTVLENVMMARYRHEHAGLLASALGWGGREEQETREAAMRRLARVGLVDKAYLPAPSLPLGEQRLLELARALASEPRLILLDEPTAGLNAVETVRLAATIGRIRANGVAILLVEHDMNLVMSVADRVIVLNQGLLLAEGSPDDVQQAPEVIEAYLGRPESTAKKVPCAMR